MLSCFKESVREDDEFSDFSFEAKEDDDCLSSSSILSMTITTDFLTFGCNWEFSAGNYSKPTGCIWGGGAPLALCMGKPWGGKAPGDNPGRPGGKLKGIPGGSAGGYPVGGPPAGYLLGVPRLKPGGILFGDPNGNPGGKPIGLYYWKLYGSPNYPVFGYCGVKNFFSAIIALMERS